MEFNLRILCIAQVIVVCLSSSTYNLNFPSDIKKDYHKLNLKADWQRDDGHYPLSNSIDQNDGNNRSSNMGQFSKIDAAWTGWNSASYSQSRDNQSELGDEASTDAEEKMIKFHVLDDDTPSSLYPNSNSDRPHYDYWKDVYWPGGRYTSGFDKRISNGKRPSPYPESPRPPYPESGPPRPPYPESPRPPYPESPQPPLNGHDYHWQDLRPVHLKPSNSLNFGFGGSASSSSSSSVGTNVISSYHRHPPGIVAGSSNVATASASAHLISNSHLLVGTSTDKITTNRKYSGKRHDLSDHYQRKRYRLEIHPGLIAAPLAGLVAFGAVSHFTTNPVMFELGLVKPKGSKGKYPDSPPYPTATAQHHHFHHYGNHHYHPTTSTTYRPPHNHHEHYPTSTEYPIIMPPEKPTLGQPWWSPLAAIIPRIRMADLYSYAKERD